MLIFRCFTFHVITPRQTFRGRAADAKSSPSSSLASRSLGHRHCAQPRTPQEATLATAALATPAIACRRQHRVAATHAAPPPPAHLAAASTCFQPTLSYFSPHPLLLLGLSGELCDDMHQGDAKSCVDERFPDDNMDSRKEPPEEPAGLPWAAPFRVSLAPRTRSHRSQPSARAARPPPPPSVRATLAPSSWTQGETRGAENSVVPYHKSTF